MLKIIVWNIFCLLSLVTAVRVSLNEDLPPQTPIIGIYTQTYNDLPNETYIVASYVKYIEMAGAQVIPIFYHYS